MIVVAVVALFVGLALLIYMALPNRQVSRARLGIEPQRREPGQAVNEFLERIGKRAGISQALLLADVSTDPGQFVLRVLLVALLLGVLGFFVSPLLGLIGFMAPVFIARSYVSYKGHKRQVAFADQLPSVLQSLVMSLRSGFALSQALDMVLSEASEPSRTEIERVLAEVRVGRDLSESLRALAVRMDNADLEWVIGAIDINRETGGNLSEILATVNDTIRGRQRLQRKVRTFTAEGKLSARILTVMPFPLALWQWHSHPDGFEKLLHGPGLLVLGACAVLMTLGWIWVRRIVTIKL